MTAGRKGDAAAGVGLDVTIMGREFRVACKPGEERELLEAVAYVDKQMTEIRDASRQNNAERIAVMTALNFANELLRVRSNPAAQSSQAQSAQPSAGGVDLNDLKRRIQSMQSTIDASLTEQERLL